MALLHEDAARFRQTYLRALHWVAMLAVPACIGLVLLAPELVRVALGPRWEAAIPPVRVLAAFGLVASLAATTGDVFKASGRSVLILRIGVVHSLALWTGLALLAPRGLVWVAVAVTLAATISCTVAFACALATLGVRPVAVLRVLWAPGVASAVMAGAVQGCAALALGEPIVRLLVLTGVGAAVYAAAIAVLVPGDLRELASMAGALRARRAAASAPDAVTVGR